MAQNGGPINVLLIGDNLLAKKTFVNAFAYFLKFSRFEDATRFPDLIKRHYEPSSVKHHGSLRIKFRPSTKRVIKEYKVDGITQDIHLIDLPTFGNVLMDEENLKKSMDFLKLSYNYIHAVYVFPRLWQFPSIQFKYLISFLMVHFEKSMFDKVSLIMNYASKALKDDVVDLVTREIPNFCAQRVHISDDEAFNYLLACYKGSVSSEDESWMRMAEAWQVSSIHARAMLRDLTRDYQTPAYKIQKTILLNQTRNSIEVLTKRLSDLCNVIQHNAVVINCERLMGGSRIKDLERRQLMYQNWFEEFKATFRMIGNYIVVNSYTTCNDAFLEYLHYRQTRANQKIKNPEEIKSRFKEKNRLIDLVVRQSDGTKVTADEMCWCLSSLESLKINPS